MAWGAEIPLDRKMEAGNDRVGTLCRSRGTPGGCQTYPGRGCCRSRAPPGHSPDTRDSRPGCGDRARQRQPGLEGVAGSCRDEGERVTAYAWERPPRPARLERALVRSASERRLVAVAAGRVGPPRRRLPPLAPRIHALLARRRGAGSRRVALPRFFPLSGGPAPINNGTASGVNEARIGS